tara:strand:+ start:105 stop:347 length:243 start_codon:yes stop_codon:yes gene_type:complete
MKAIIHITLKEGVLDPQGKAINVSLNNMGFEKIEDVRQGKFFEIEINNSNKTDVYSDVDNMCKQLLVNTVIENYKIDILD